MLCKFPLTIDSQMMKAHVFNSLIVVLSCRFMYITFLSSEDNTPVVSISVYSKKLSFLHVVERFSQLP